MVCIPSIAAHSCSLGYVFELKVQWLISHSYWTGLATYAQLGQADLAVVRTTFS